MESDLAWHALKSAFGHHLDFRELCDAEDPNTEDDVIDQLFKWAEEMKWPEGSGRKHGSQTKIQLRRYQTASMSCPRIVFGHL